MSDNHTPANATDDHLASFSSTGPTYEGFVKPEVIAPGGHVLASMPNTSALATEIFGTITDPYTQFPLSGTSMATAVTSGVVALLLQQQPSLTPDEVKCKLMAGAAPAITSTGTLAYSVFQQGAGLINAMGAINTSATGCANQGLNISADLAGTTHFGGPANQDASGNFYIMDMTSSTPFAEDPTDGFTWSASFPYNQGYAWSDGYAWSKGYAWSQGYAWSKTYTWSSNAVWSQGYAWSKSLTWAAAAPSAATLSAQSLVAPFPAQEE